VSSGIQHGIRGDPKLSDLDGSGQLRKVVGLHQQLYRLSARCPHVCGLVAVVPMMRRESTHTTVVD
jgi:hypothetical protein